MKINHTFLAGLLFLFSFNVFATNLTTVLDIHEKNGEIFTAKDKDYLQQWHYDQVLKMGLSEKDRDEYFTILNRFTYKMSRLGLSKYHYTSTERKNKFDELAEKLDAEMKNKLTPDNYAIHQSSFNKIESIVYEKHNWEE